MTLSELIERYVTFKRSLGLSFRAEAKVLRAFCRMMGDRDVGEITPRQVLDYLTGTGPITSNWHAKFRVLNGLYRFAMGRGYVEISPLPPVQPKRPPSQVPYIYTTDELRRRKRGVHEALWISDARQLLARSQAAVFTDARLMENE